MSGLRVRVWQAEGGITATAEPPTYREGRFFIHWTSGGNIIAPGPESDGFATANEAHRAVKRVWRAFGRAHGRTAYDLGFVSARPPYARDSLKPHGWDAT